MTVRLVDCRSRDAYEAGHVPGAVHLDPEGDLSAPVFDPAIGGRHPLPDPHVLGAAFANAGIGPGTFVLAYDEGTGWVVRGYYNLSDDAESLLLLRSDRFDPATEIRLPLRPRPGLA